MSLFATFNTESLDFSMSDITCLISTESKKIGISKSSIARTIQHALNNGLYKKKMEEIYGDEWLQHDKLIQKQTKKGVALSNTKEQTETTTEIPF